MDLIVDINRLDWPETGIFVRAKKNEEWGSYDIIHLEKESLALWLRSIENPTKEINLAERIIFLIFGHEHSDDD